MGNEIIKRLIIVTPDHQVHNIFVPGHLIKRCNYFKNKKEYEGKYICTTRLDVTRKDIIDFVCLMEGEMNQNYDIRSVYIIAKHLGADIMNVLRIGCLLRDNQELIDFVDEDQIDMCRAVDMAIRNGDYSNVLLSYQFKDYNLLMMYLSVSDTIKPYSNRNLSLINDLSNFQDSDVVKLAKKFVSLRPNVLIRTPCGDINHKERCFMNIQPGKLHFLESLNEVETLLIATQVFPYN